MPEYHANYENVSAEVCRRTSLEKLADLLIADLMADIAGAGCKSADSFFFQPEIIVPNKSMRRYLTMRLARTNGIAAGIRFSSLMSLFHADKIDARSIGWRIFGILLSNPGSFPALNEWIGGNAKRRYDLSNQLGQLYYQYMLYRPDWLNVWENGGVPEELKREKTAFWQGPLWRLTAGNDWKGRHFAAKYANLTPENRRGLFGDFRGRNAGGGRRRKIRIFGFSQLAPAVMDCLAVLSEQREQTSSPSGAVTVFSGADADVTLYQLAPSLKLFYDERNQTFKEEIKELVRLSGRIRQPGEASDEPEAEVSPDEGQREVYEEQQARMKRIRSDLFFQHNPLIASFGMQSRVTMTLTEELHFQDDVDVNDPEILSLFAYEEPSFPGNNTSGQEDAEASRGNAPVDSGADTILHRLQEKILKDVPERETEADALDEEQKQACRSVQIRDCYSAFREVEAAHNFILHCLDESPGLSLNDIFIMTPSNATATFAPLVDAVFNHASDTGRLSVSIADRPQTMELPSYRTFLKILSLYKGEFTASDVFAILQDNAVQERLGVTADDCREFRDCAVQAGVRWGWDAEDHKNENAGGCDFPQNTWQAGIDRLLLNYAMDIDPAAPFEVERETLYAVPGYRGGAGIKLGKIAYFIGQLHAFAREMRRNSSDGMPFRRWREDLMQAVSVFFGAESELAILLAGILKDWGEVLSDAQMQPEGADAGNAPGWELDDTPLTSEIVLAYLQNQITESGDSTKGFMRGSITFCGLKPMRSIPADVIVLLGMNHEAFPGEDSASEFDLMQKKRRPGDPDKRMEARQLFLDVILAARKYLYISYVGRDIHDRKKSPPSVCVDVLRSYLEHEFGKNSFVDIQEPIQAFSPELFEPWPEDAPHRKPNQSYSQKLLDAARMIRSNRTQPLQPLFPLNEISQDPDETLLHVSLDDLCRFFRNPMNEFVRKRLDASVSVFEETAPEDSEPFEGSIDFGRRLELYELYLRVRPDSEKSRTALAQISLDRMKADGILPMTQTLDAWNDWNAISALGDAVIAAEKSAEPFRIPAKEMTFPCGITLALPETEAFAISGSGVQIIPCMVNTVSVNLLVSSTLKHIGANLRRKTVTRIICLDGGSKIVLEAIEMEPTDAAEKMNGILELYREGMRKPLPFFPKTLYSLLQNDDGRYVGVWSGYNGGESKDFSMFFGEKLPPEDELRRLAMTVFCVGFQLVSKEKTAVQEKGGGKK